MGKKSHIKKNRQTKKDAINAQIEALNELTVPEKESLAQTTKSSEVLTVLADDEDWRVRQAVGYNPSTPADVLRVLADDGYAVVGRPRC